MPEAWARTLRHPSPHKDRATVFVLLLGIIGGPFAWTGQFLVSYGLTSYACYPGPNPTNTLLPGWRLLGPGLTLLNAVAFSIALAALVASYRAYWRTRTEMQGEINDLVDIGEGRSRFLALCGCLTSGAFAIVIVFNTLSLYLVPPCTR